MDDHDKLCRVIRFHAHPEFCDCKWIAEIRADERAAQRDRA
jgi:hypothetical protein